MQCADRERLVQDMVRARDMYVAAIHACQAGDGVTMEQARENLDAARFVYDAALRSVTEHVHEHGCAEAGRSN